LQSVQNYQTEKHVHKNGHDERYKYVEMQCQNIDNKGEKSCNQNTHIERNEIQFMIVIGRKNESRDIQRYAENDNQETGETNNQTGIDLQEQE
jgi:hypothetical protein